MKRTVEVTLEIELDERCEKLSKQDIREYLDFQFGVEGSSISIDHPLRAKGDLEVIESGYSWGY